MNNSKDKHFNYDKVTLPFISHHYDLTMLFFI